MNNFSEKRRQSIKNSINWFNKPFEKNSAVSTLILIVGIMIVVGCTCGKDNGQNSSNKEIAQNSSDKPTSDKPGNNLPKKLESYQIRSFKFSYYLIPKNQSRGQLIETAQKLHAEEPGTNLILVDDDSQLREYPDYVKEFSNGNTGKPYPKEWVKNSLVANVQKFMDGKWYLCEKNLMEKITELP